MKTWLQTQFSKMISALCERWHLILEHVALHHQIAVLERSAKRPRFSNADRFFWMLLATVWSRWQDTLKIVQADTVRRWRRQGWRQLLGWRREQTRPGRPPIPVETQALIRRMNRENALWGAPRIHSELALLGIRVSRTTVAKYMDRRAGPPSQTWRTFLRNHLPHLIDTVPSTELMPNIRAHSVQFLHALSRGLHRMVASWSQRFFRHPAQASARPRAITSEPRAWKLEVVDGVQASERSPPVPMSLFQEDSVAMNRPLDIMTSEVRLTPSAVGHWGRYPVILRQSRNATTDEGRDTLQRYAA